MDFTPTSTISLNIQLCAAKIIHLLLPKCIFLLHHLYLYCSFCKGYFSHFKLPNLSQSFKAPQCAFGERNLELVVSGLKLEYYLSHWLIMETLICHLISLPFVNLDNCKTKVLSQVIPIVVDDKEA